MHRGRLVARVFLAAAALQFTELCARTDQAMELSGNDWHICADPDGNGAEQRLFDADPKAWIAATVPGNIQADLEAAKELKPLWYGAGDPALKAVAEKDWWYRKDFTIPATMAGKRLTLVFDGVDQKSDIWLNGQKLGSNTGMFRRFWFDVTESAKPGALNRLAVRIARCPKFWTHSDKSGQNIREFKSQTNDGWDWGVPIATLGIWKDVRLEATGPARIDWSRVQTSLSPDYSKATVNVTLEIESSKELAGSLRLRLSGDGRQAEATVQAALKKGANTVRAEIPLEAPALWWPAGHGQQPLYTVAAELSAGGTPSDSRTTRFGIRDLQWVHTEGAAANHISRFQLIINGRPVRMLGSNLIPADLLFGRMHERTLNLMQHAKATGMNTLRLWGGGVILHKSAYDLADELGLLLIQEFPLANHMPPQDAEYLETLEKTSRNIVRQVRNHPSIVEFGGGNEMPWNSSTDHPAIHLLRRVVAEEDGRIFRATCPDYGATHGPWYFDPWQHCRHFEQLRTMRAGEYGSASPANLEVWHREIPVKDQWPIVGMENPVLRRKNASWAAFSGDHWLRKCFLEEVFSPFDAVPTMVKAGQFYGAEGLRYATDALRRKGKRVGGLMTWDFNEPWPNIAGSYLIDYDGRPRMMHSFFKQAIAPVSLSLKYDRVFYPLKQGLKAELFLTSDAPQRTENLRWSWIARDRRGAVFAQKNGHASVAPLEVQLLDAIAVMPPEKTVLGPVFMELRLEDAVGKLITERLHIFAMANQLHPFGKLVGKGGADPDDDAALVTTKLERPTDPENLIYRLLGKDPKAPAEANDDKLYNGWITLNDGIYGNDLAWSKGNVQLKFKQPATLGRFKFSRDRTGVMTDRAADYLKVETSMDGIQWQTVFEADKLTQLPGWSPAKPVQIEVAPVEARFLKVALTPPGMEKGPFPVIDEFEVYAPNATPPAALPHISVLELQDFSRPLRRTTLEVAAAPVRVEGAQEVLELTVKNTGSMTAFPVEPHPLISYRTDLFIDNNHCFIPPGESRTLTIRSEKNSRSGLTLAQTGWRISCWNAEEVTVAPRVEVLLAVGRRDKMCREFAGYFEPNKIAEATAATLSGTRPDPAQLPYRLDGGKSVCFEFHGNAAADKQGGRLRIHTADQSKEKTVVSVNLNGNAMEQILPTGYGIQKDDPAYMACPVTLEFAVPAGVLREGGNVLKVQVTSGWFTWDSVEIVQSAK